MKVGGLFGALLSSCEYIVFLIEGSIRCAYDMLSSIMQLWETLESFCKSLFEVMFQHAS